MTGNVLEAILGTVRDRLRSEVEAPGLVQRAREAAGVRRRGGRQSLKEALTVPGVRIIAECKRRSPSAGLLRDDFEPVDLARRYARAGAAAISVVTEPHFFGGQRGWIPLIRQAVSIPVLQKDFLISSRQIYEAVLLGADAVLLIVRALAGGMLSEMVTVAEDLGLETLVEVHDRSDLESALASPATIIGINARNLSTLAVDLEGAAELAALVPPDRTVVMESGIGGPDDVETLLSHGLRQYLIGSFLVRSGNVEAALEGLIACGRR